jgi:hypothetical protein
MQYLATVILLVFTTMSAYAADPTRGAATEKDQATQQMQSELGKPVPGSASDQETTIKKRDPSKAQSSEQSSQVTLGGAKYSVTGEVLKVEGDYYFVKDADSGDEVRLLVNNDTHVICAPEHGGQQESAAVGKRGAMKDPEATKPQAAQGQKKDETAAGAGTRMGSADCQFKSGDKIKAEVSDVGTVTTLRYVADTKGTSKRPPLEVASGDGGEPQMKDTTPGGQALKKRAEGAAAPPDLRGDEPAAEPKQQAKADTSASKECRDCQVVRGRVLKVEEDSLVVRDRSKQEIRIHLDKTTIIGQRNLKDEPFKEGDRVEAYVTPKGHAHSISLMRAQGGIPGDPDAGG